MKNFDYFFFIFDFGGEFDAHTRIQTRFVYGNGDVTWAHSVLKLISLCVRSRSTKWGVRVLVGSIHAHIHAHYACMCACLRERRTHQPRTITGFVLEFLPVIVYNRNDKVCEWLCVCWYTCITRSHTCSPRLRCRNHLNGIIFKHS